MGAAFAAYLLLDYPEFPVSCSFTHIRLDQFDAYFVEIECDSYNNDDPNTHSAFESTNIFFTPQGLKLYTQKDDYLLRPIEFEELSLYEMNIHFQLIPLKKQTHHLKSYSLSVYHTFTSP